MEPTVGNRMPVCSFVCDHAVCAQCDTALYVRADDRCPTCRAPRKGASASGQHYPREARLDRTRTITARQSTLPYASLPQETVFFPVDVLNQSEDQEEMGLQMVLLAQAREQAAGLQFDTGPTLSPSSVLNVAASADPIIATAISALEDPTRVDLGEFANVVQMLRTRSQTRLSVRRGAAGSA